MHETKALLPGPVNGGQWGTKMAPRANKLSPVYYNDDDGDDDNGS